MGGNDAINLPSREKSYRITLSKKTYLAVSRYQEELRSELSEEEISKEKTIAHMLEQLEIFKQENEKLKSIQPPDLDIVWQGLAQEDKDDLLVRIVSETKLRAQQKKKHEAVTIIVSLKEQGYTYQKIVDKLNAMGVETPTGLGHWTRSKISYLLSKKR